MKQRPILFSTEMVQAILVDRKTVTRRIMKPQPEAPRALYGNTIPSPRLVETAYTMAVAWHWSCPRMSESTFAINPCPHGKPGDVLWVREAFCPSAPFSPFTGECSYKYKADGDGNGWSSPIYMPKAAARLWLEITDVRVERVQDITEEQAILEGVAINTTKGDFNGSDGPPEWWNYMAGPEDSPCLSAAESYATLWTKINGPDSWDANPWVWVIEFKRIEKPQV